MIFQAALSATPRPKKNLDNFVPKWYCQESNPPPYFSLLCYPLGHHACLV